MDIIAKCSSDRARAKIVHGEAICGIMAISALGNRTRSGFVMARILAALVGAMLLLVGAKPVINLLSIHINLRPWPSSSRSDIAGTAAEPSRPTETNRSPKLVTYSPGMRLFDGRGKPIAWYYKDSNGAIELYDTPGYHPPTGRRLLPINAEIAADLQRNAQDCVTLREEDGKGNFLRYVVQCDEDSVSSGTKR